MFYERRIRSLGGVEREAETMDEDAGIRMSGRYGGRSCYAFVSRFGREYTVMVYEKKGGRGDGLGKRLATETLENTKELKEFLRKVAAGKVEAFAY